MFLRHERYNKHKVKLINIVSFLCGFSSAVSLYVLSLYFADAVGQKSISLFFLVSYIAVLITLLSLHKIIKRMGKSYSVIFFMGIKLVSLALLLLFWSEPVLNGAIALALYVFVSSLVWVGLDVMLESFSIDKMSGRIRGLYLTIANTGFILGPFLSFFLLDKYGFFGIFSTLLVIDSIIFIMTLAGLRNINHVHKREQTVIELVKGVWRHKNFVRVYLLSFICSFFYSVMIIYSPTYFTGMGFTLHEISIMFTIMLIPFVLFQYPAGLIADSKIGERKMLIISFVIMSLSVLIMYFVTSNNIYIWSFVLFLTRIGAALIEVFSDSYFYKRIDGDDIGVIDFFRTGKPMAYIVFSFISFIMLQFLETKTVFLLLAIVASSGIYLAYKLEEGRFERFRNYLSKKLS